MTDKERTRHGLRAAKVAIRLAGMHAINRNTRAGRELLQWRSQLIADAGGEANLTAAKLSLIDTACRTRALLDHIDAWLLGQKTIVNRKGKRLIPIVAERQTIADALQRQLNALGLGRSENPASALPDGWIQKVEPEPEASEPKAEEKSPNT